MGECNNKSIVKSIVNTTKEQCIELIKFWQSEDESFDDNDLDMWEIYRDYIDGKKEIVECNAAIEDRMEYFTGDEKIKYGR